jgi:hypothetical protein
MTSIATTDERDDVRGFMTCSQGLALAHGYGAIAQIMWVTTGSPALTTEWAGRARGVMEGACD